MPDTTNHDELPGMTDQDLSVSMPDRAWLVNLITDSRDLGFSPTCQADVLIEAGWRPPPRVITDEDLDALNPNAVLRWEDPDGITQCSTAVELQNGRCLNYGALTLIWTPGDTE